MRWFPVAFLTDNNCEVSNLSKVAMQWLEVDSNLRPSGYKAQNIRTGSASEWFTL